MPYRENAITSLVHFLNNGDEADRCYAARSLGEIKAESAVDSLIEHMRDEDIDVCIDAVTALGQIADIQAAPSLLEALENETDGEIKTAIASSLGCFEGPAVKKALTQLAIKRPETLAEDLGDWDSYWDIQLESIKSLIKQGGTDKTEEIASLIDDEDGQDIEAEVLKILALSGEAGFRHLQNKLNDTSSRTRRRVVHALRFQNSEASKLALKNALTDEGSQVRISALSSIAFLQASELLEEVISLLSDHSAIVRQEALKVLSAIGTNSKKPMLTTDHLLPLLNDSDSAVRLTILSLLKDQAHRNSLTLSTEQLDTIKTCLNSINPDEAALACTIVSDLQDKSATDSLLKILENTQEDEMLRKEATLGLGKLGVNSPRIMQVLQKHIPDESRVIRLAVLQTLMMLEQAIQDTRILTLDNTQPEATIDTKHAAASNNPFISDPMELLLASLNGELTFDPDVDPQETNNDNLTKHPDRIEVVEVVEEDDKRPAHELEQSTLASMEADQLLIAENYSAEYRELEDTCHPEANSTLEALSQDNVAAALMTNNPVEPHVQSIMSMVDALPEELDQFGDAVRANNTAAEQMVDQSKGTPLINDIRHLAARALTEVDVSMDSFTETQRNKIVRVIDGLILALSDQDDQLRCEAADAIYQFALKNPKTPGLGNTFGGLVSQLQFGTPEFRIKAVKALGSLQQKAAIPVLIDCLNDKDSNIRIHAIISLGQLINTRQPRKKVSLPIQRIVDMLDDPGNGVRKAAIDVLTDLEYQSAVAKMIDIALEKGGAMARIVGKSLRKMNASEAGNKITLRLNDAENSADRRFLMEIIEEMFKPAPKEKYIAYGEI